MVLQRAFQFDWAYMIAGCQAPPRGVDGVVCRLIPPPGAYGIPPNFPVVVVWCGCVVWFPPRHPLCGGVVWVVCVALTVGNLPHLWASAMHSLPHTLLPHTILLHTIGKHGLSNFQVLDRHPL